MDAGFPLPVQVLSAPATSVAHAWVSADIYSELEYQARLKRLHPDQLTARILTAVLVLGRGDELLEQARALLADAG
jgi:hypothetical protein